MTLRIPLLCAALATALSGQVVINEFNTGTPDWIELRNAGTVAFDVSGYSVETFASQTGTPVSEGVFVIPVGTIIPAGGTLMLQENGSADAPTPTASCGLSVGYNFNWSSTRSVAILLRDAFLGAIDYVYRQGPGGATGTPGISPGTTWTGAFIATGDSCSRVTDLDNDAASDWTTASPASPCAPNAGQTSGQPVSLSLATNGNGDVSLTITTFPLRPFAEFFNVISTQDYMPNGSGPLFGVGLDGLVAFSQPLLPGSPFHGRLDSLGRYTLSTPPGTVPTGTFIEVVTLVIDPVAIAVVPSSAAEITF
ncbi:MAG: hypothetical protein CMJ83_10380 [Planctomycetes bacterium]|nr:hypothetical protein [Planctomycetota bacterium]